MALFAELGWQTVHAYDGREHYVYESCYREGRGI
jgi:hypothetical protein